MPIALQDSRRLTGPNIAWQYPGAVVDVALDEDTAEQAILIWERNVRRLLDAVGWSREDSCVRRVSGGASLIISAPIDALYAATEINEWAWSVVEAEYGGDPPPDLDEAAARLRAVIADERRPSTIALRDAAIAHGVTFLSDDDEVSVGLGTGSRTWPVAEVPAPDTVDWSAIHDILVVLVTGCNGKTTSIRLLSAIVAAARYTPGLTSTDGIWVGSELVEPGDYSGPGGARTVLRRPDVDVALLETARGGMLRRGLTLTRADVALITNVANDHLGEFGVSTLEGLAQAKLLVTSVIGPTGRVVLNADDDSLVNGSGDVDAPIIWYSLTPDNPVVIRHRRAGGEVVVLEDGEVVRYVGNTRSSVMVVDRIPITIGGAARHNIHNVLGVVGVSGALGIADRDIAMALAGFKASREDNPGRLNLFDVGGIQVIVDFAHNPHGVAALGEMTQAMPAKRRLFLIGQAGDRDDESIKELARAAWSTEPDCIIVKEMPKYLRGREPGVIPAMIEGELLASGAPAEAIVHADSELVGVRRAIAWGETGDLLLLTAHEHREEMLEFMTRLEAGPWKAGDPVPQFPSSLNSPVP